MKLHSPTSQRILIAPTYPNAGVRAAYQLNPANAQGKGATGKLGATENAENAQAEGAEFGGNS